MCNNNCRLVKKLRRHCATWKAIAEANAGSYKAASEMCEAWLTELNRTKRALWLARANAAKNMKEMWDATTDTGNLRSRKGPAWIKTGKRLEVSEWRELWSIIETKCRAYADKFKEE